MEIDLGYKPRAPFVDYHRRRSRFAAIVAHRRAGKTVAAIMDQVDAALSFDALPNGRFAYVAPFYAQAKDVAWTYLKSYALKVPGTIPNEAELRVDFPNGNRVRLYGADNYDRMRGIYLDDVVMDEVGDMDPRAWSEVIRPALADRQGKATFIGTPKGRNGFYEIVERAKDNPDWYLSILRASETGLIPPGELEALRSEMSEDEFLREFECSFDAAVEGAYYARLLNEAEIANPKRIGHVPHDPALEVHAAWDLGIGDSTAIWLAQFAGREIRLIDYIENNGVALDWYGRALREKPYLYAPLILPHDAQARELGTGKSRVEMLEAMGFRTRIAPRLSVEDGIETVRRMLPRTWIDATRCDTGLRAVREYREKVDPKRKVSFGPLHDWTSHSADALRYLMTAYEEPTASRRERQSVSVQGGWMS